MGRNRRLKESYRKYIEIPWRDDAAAAQRVIFCVYNENDELNLRAKIDEFEIVTHQSGHEWRLYDFTNSFADWLCEEEYVTEYFSNPDLLADLLPDEFLQFLEESFSTWVKEFGDTKNAVICLMGVGSLFGFAKVKDTVDRLASKVDGKLVVMFPGSYENNNYRLLDRYDGWNYLAIPITATKEG